MSRRITALICLFTLLVLAVTIGTAQALAEGMVRQTRDGVSRYMVYQINTGTSIPEITNFARWLGYEARVVDLDMVVNERRKLDITQEALAITLADGQNALMVIGPSASLFVGAQGSIARYIVWALILGSIVFALILGRSIHRPISSLIAASMAITAGHYSKRVKAQSHTELGLLIREFNAMAEHLEQTMEKLNNNSTEVEALLTTMRNGLIAVDADLHVIRINPAAREMFEVYGNPHGKYILDVARNAALETHLGEAMHQNEMYTADMAVRIGKENRTLRLYVTPLVRDGVVVGVLALIEDITQLQRLENVRVNFIANVTHELKTPLTSIRGFVETLQQTGMEDPDAAMHFLNIIQMEAERLTRLIDDVLNLSSLESHRRGEDMESLVISSYARMVCDVLRPSAVEKDIELLLEDESGGAQVLASEDKVKQMFINLIDNAIKYTPEGGHVTVRLARGEDKLLLEVEDDGIGIEHVHIPRLFERFYRVDKGRSRAAGGTGLGLAIVKHIVMEMHGTIGVKSEYGEGTVFTVTLPVV